MSTNTQALLEQQLVENLVLLEQSLQSLRYSEAKSQQVIGKDVYTQEELEHLEALTARFARTVDILTQKVLKTLFIRVGENLATFLDAANLAEKLGFVERAEDLIALRTLRNEISHEYAVEKLNEIFSETLSLLSALYAVVAHVTSYVSEKIKK